MAVVREFYEFFVPAKVIFGLNLVDRIGSIIKEHTKLRKVLIICDPGLWAKPALERLTSALRKENLELEHVFTAISSNPKKSECEQGLEITTKYTANIYIALGGGSVLDAAKWIARRAAIDLFITIPTTAGTGSELNEWAVLMDDQTHVKESILCRAADIAVLDATLTTSMPPSVTLLSGMDAFSHGLEAYLSNRSNSLTDMLAIKGCKIIISNLESCLKNGNDLKARANMLEASMYTGMAMLNAGLGVLHCIANVIPGFYPSYAHGFVCGSLIKNTITFNKKAMTFKKNNKISHLSRQVDKIFKRYLSKLSMTGIIIERSSVSAISLAASTNLNRFTNPREVTQKGIEKIISETFVIH